MINSQIIFESVARKILIEGRLEDIRKKYPQISYKDFETAKRCDPSVGFKYLDFILRTGAYISEDYVKSILYFFDKLKISKLLPDTVGNLNRYPNFPALVKEINKSYLFRNISIDIFLYSTDNIGQLDGKIRWDAFKQIWKADPTQNKEFVPIMLLMWAEGHLYNEDIYKMEEYLSYEEARKWIKEMISGEIYDEEDSIVSTSSIARYLRSIGLLKETDFNIEKDLPKIKGEYSEVFENDTFYIFSPKTFKASCVLGKGTEWCTAGGIEQYKNYTSDDNKLYIILNKNTGKRIQFDSKDGSSMDEDDKMTLIPYELWPIVLKFAPNPKLVYKFLIQDPGVSVEISLEQAAQIAPKMFNFKNLNGCSQTILGEYFFLDIDFQSLESIASRDLKNHIGYLRDFDKFQYQEILKILKNENYQKLFDFLNKKGFEIKSASDYPIKYNYDPRLQKEIKLILDKAFSRLGDTLEKEQTIIKNAIIEEFLKWFDDFELNLFGQSKAKLSTKKAKLIFDALRDGGGDLPKTADTFNVISYFYILKLNGGGIGDNFKNKINEMKLKIEAANEKIKQETLNIIE